MEYISQRVYRCRGTEMRTRLRNYRVQCQIIRPIIDKFSLDFNANYYELMTVDCRKKNLQAYKTLSIQKYMYNDNFSPKLDDL